MFPVKWGNINPFMADVIESIPTRRWWAHFLFVMRVCNYVQHTGHRRQVSKLKKLLLAQGKLCLPLPHLAILQGGLSLSLARLNSFDF